MSGIISEEYNLSAPAAHSLLSIPKGVRMLRDGTIWVGNLLEARESEGGICVAVLDCGRKEPDLVGLPEEILPELRALVGKRAGLGSFGGEVRVRDLTGIGL